MAVPDTDVWTWWGSTTTSQMWAAVLYQGPGQIAQVGELLTDIPSTATDVEKIAERIAIGIDEAEIEAVSRQELRFER